MKYLCLAYGDEELHQGGHLALIASLAPTRSTTPLRPLNGKTVLCDGPYAETHEQVGGFFYPRG